MSDDTTHNECDSDESIEQLLAAVGERIKSCAENSEHIPPARLYLVAHDRSAASEAEIEHFEQCEMCRKAYEKYEQVLVTNEEIFSGDDADDVCPEEKVVRQIPTAALRSAFQSEASEWLSLSSSVTTELNQRRTSIDILDEVNELDAKLNEEGADATVLARAIREMMGDTNGNRVLEAAVGWAIKQAYSAGRTATSRLYDQLGEIIEATKALSGSIWLIDTRENGERFVAPLITYNLPTEDVEYKVSTGCPGVIAHLASTGFGKPKFLRDVKDHPQLYIQALKETVSELALPILIGAIDGSGHHDDNSRRFVAVLDLQFIELPCSDGPDEEQAFLSRVEYMVERLRPDLEVIETLRNVDENWCCYHPLVHSGCFRKSYEELCRCVTAAIGFNNATMTIWSADWPRRKLHAYATKGYDYEFCGENELEIDDSETGWGLMQAIRGLDLRVVSDPQTMFSRSDKARLQGVRRAFTAPFSEYDWPEKHEDVLGCINIYFFGKSTPNDQREYQEIEQRLPQLARFVGRLTNSYMKARKRYYEERREFAFKHPVEGEAGVGAKLWALLELINEIFGGNSSTSPNAVQPSIWARNSKRLFCVKSNGLLRLKAPTADELGVFPFERGRIAPFEADTWGPIYYDIENDTHSGYTSGLVTDVTRVRVNGDLVPAIRRCKVEGSKGDGVTARPSGRFTEYFGTETEFDRWFLGVSVLDQQMKKVIGVIRVVRPLVGRPFTGSDEELLLTLARGASHVLEHWQRDSGQYFEDMSWQNRRNAVGAVPSSETENVQSVNLGRTIYDRSEAFSAAAQSLDSSHSKSDENAVFSEAVYCLVRVVVKDRETNETFCEKLIHTTRGARGDDGKTVYRLPVSEVRLLADWLPGHVYKSYCEYIPVTDSNYAQLSENEVRAYLQSNPNMNPLVRNRIEALLDMLVKSQMSSEIL